MAARRQSKASRRAAAAASRPPEGTPSPRRSSATRRAAGSTGSPAVKVRIACPQCGSEYRIAADQLDRQVRCANCDRTFVPQSAGRRGRRSRNTATPFIMGGGIVVFVVLTFILISQSGRAGASKTDVVDPVASIHEENPRVRDVWAWTDAIAAGNKFQLGTLSDFEALRQRLGIDPTGSPDEQRDRVIERLLQGEETQVLREFEVTSALIPEPEDAELASGTVQVYLTVREAHAKGWTSTAELAVSYVFANDRARVTGFEITEKPRKKVPRRKAHKAHEDIGKVKVLERDFGGRMIKVTEAEVVPLGHLEGTSEELQKEVDQLIEQLCDIEGPGALAQRSVRRLTEIGRPSIPRLLNKFYETPLDTQDNVLRLRRITGALSTMTGQRFGFNPSVIQSADTVSTDEHRKSVLRQWYAWWSDNYNKDYTVAIDKEESLDIDPPARGKDAPKPASETKKNP